MNDSTSFGSFKSNALGKNSAILQSLIQNEFFKFLANPTLVVIEVFFSK